MGLEQKEQLNFGKIAAKFWQNSRNLSVDLAQALGFHHLLQKRLAT